MNNIVQKQCFSIYCSVGWREKGAERLHIFCVPSCYLELLDKLQKWICRTIGPSYTVYLEPLAQCQNVASLSLFYRHYFGRCSPELAKLVPFPYSWGRSTHYSDSCMIFLSSFLDVTRMSISTVSFLTQLDSGILCLLNGFIWPMI